MDSIISQITKIFNESKLIHLMKSQISTPSAEELLKYIAFNENPLNNRDKRLHPFIQEGIQIVFDQNFDLKNNIIKITTNYQDGELGKLFDKHGSDKNTRHSYGMFYEKILSKLTKPQILEIGLGSVNAFPYAALNPGGSIAAWREFCPDAMIVGVDIDEVAVKSINELGFVMDQTSGESIQIVCHELINKKIKFNLIVDDGFHDLHANIRTYLEFYSLLLDDEIYVIEDVHKSLIPLWSVLAKSLPGNIQIFDFETQRPEVDDNVLVTFTKTVDTLFWQN